MDINSLAAFLTFVGNCCLLLTAILGIAWFALSLRRSLLSSIIVTSLSVYVVNALIVLSIHPTILARADALNSVADTDYELRTCELYSGQPKTSLAESFKARSTKDIQKTEALLDRANFESSTLSAYHVVVLHCLHYDCTKALDTLSHSEGEDGLALAGDLQVAFGSPTISRKTVAAGNRVFVSREQAAEIANDLKLRMPLKWFQNYALDELYSNSGQTELLDSLKREQLQQRDVLIQRMLVGEYSGPSAF